MVRRVLLACLLSIEFAATAAAADAQPAWPEAVAFLGSDASVYVRKRGDAWGVCFRVNDSRAYTEFDIPCPAKIGRKLYLLKPARPGIQPKLLLDAGRGVIGSPTASIDGRSLLVAMAAEGESFFHIYRVPVDGGRPQRLTDGPFHDLDPAELPDGRIAFASTRLGTFEEYHNPPSRALFVMNADGSGIRPLTYTPIWDNEPRVMADGRIAFIRTDNFFDRGKVETTIHAIHPDGTAGVTEMGADLGPEYGVRLRAFGYGSPAPLSDGRLAAISTRGNLVGRPGSADAAFARIPGPVGDMAPMPDGRLLCTVGRGLVVQGVPGTKLEKVVRDAPGAKPAAGPRHLVFAEIGIVEVRDGKSTTVTLFEADEPIHSPVFVGPRPRPPLLPQNVNPEDDRPGATGVVFCSNVFRTRNVNAGWPHVRAVRVLGGLNLTLRSSHSHIVHAGIEAVDLGTVPIAPDGSIFAEVPANMPLAFQMVDAEGRSELNEMSWIYVRPGERRTCVGCHAPRDTTPRTASRYPMALSKQPVKLLGQGQPLRFRANNSGVTGFSDLQFDRFREVASINLHSGTPAQENGGWRQEVARLVEQLRSKDEAERIAATRRLAVYRDRAAAAALAESLADPCVEVRLGAAVALAACGIRDSAPRLIATLDDRNPMVAQAAAVALENIVGSAPAKTGTGSEPAQPDAATWQAWLAANPWDKIEQSLISELAGSDTVRVRRAAVALGHIGGPAAKQALRQQVDAQRKINPYPAFDGNNRIDSFTFNDRSPYNPRKLQELVRSLGYLKDAEAAPLLIACAGDNLQPAHGNLFLAEAAVEALGRIATPEAERALVDLFGRLGEYHTYVGWYSDHPALYGSHSSPVHYRVLEALDAIGSTAAGPIAAGVIRSVPTDPDRALLPGNDDYERVAGRVLRRSGRGDALIETCLATLGDTEAKADAELAKAIATTHGVWAGKPTPPIRASQILSCLSIDPRYEPRVRAAFERYRATVEKPSHRPLDNPPGGWIPTRNWTCFYLARALGNLADSRSLDALLAALEKEPTEAVHGRPDPAEPNIHFLHLEYTPCWRAAAAWAVGRIGDRRAVPVLLGVVRNLDNAPDVRYAAAVALGTTADAASRPALESLAKDYPEVFTRQALERACAKGEGGRGKAEGGSTLSMKYEVQSTE